MAAMLMSLLADSVTCVYASVFIDYSRCCFSLLSGKFGLEVRCQFYLVGHHVCCHTSLDCVQAYCHLEQNLERGLLSFVSCD